MTEQPTLLHFAAEAHRRKWAFAEYDSAAFSVLDCIGNEMRAAYDATQSAAETPDAESPALVPDGPGEATTATPEAVRKLAEDVRAEWNRAMIAEARAEAAEAKLAAIEALCRDIGASVPESVRTPTVAVVRILAIIDGEGDGASGLRQRPGDQRLPVPNGGPSMHDLVAGDVRRRHPGAPEIAAVVRDLAARKQLDLDRYGSLLQAGNGRDALRDLHEEQLDALVYCRQWLEENDEEHPWALVMRTVYRDLLTGALTVRRVMDDDPRPCQCHDSFAAVSPTHPGHCCFLPADQDCHREEVEAWERGRDQLLGREPGS